MALVAYDYSDESDSGDVNSDEDEKFSTKEISNSLAEAATNSRAAEPTPKKLDQPLDEVEDEKLFSNLPNPKSTFSVPDNTLKLLSKKSQPVKIVLPSLDEIKKSTKEEGTKKLKPSTKGSGLFALLPAPKNAISSMVPDSVKAKQLTPNPTKPVVKKPLVPDQLRRAAAIKKAKSVAKKKEEDDDDDPFEPESFFFSASDDVKPEEMLPVDIPNIPETSKTEAIPRTDEIQQVSNEVAAGSTWHDVSHSNWPGETQSANSEMDIDSALTKLVGAGARKRKHDIPDEIVDVNVNSIVGDAYKWLSKDLTTEQEHRSFKKTKNLSNVERRKHQITYLASQAKEKELELRNQWANSRMTRQQTQSKYGF